MPESRTLSAQPWTLVCARCGDRIGIYEQLACQLPDGSLVTSGFLGLPEHLQRQDGPGRFFHAGCLPAAG